MRVFMRIAGKSDRAARAAADKEHETMGRDWCAHPKSPEHQTRLTRANRRPSALRGLAFEEGKREAEGQARANLVHGASVREGMTYADVKAQVVAYLVDQADQA